MVEGYFICVLFDPSRLNRVDDLFGEGAKLSRGIN